MPGDAQSVADSFDRVHAGHGARPVHDLSDARRSHQYTAGDERGVKAARSLREREHRSDVARPAGLDELGQAQQTRRNPFRVDEPAGHSRPSSVCTTSHRP